MPNAVRDTLFEALTGDTFTEAERWVIRWQFERLGHFEKALAEAICRASDDNLKLLARVFPMQVTGFLVWRDGDLGRRLRNFGIEI